LLIDRKFLTVFAALLLDIEINSIHVIGAYHKNAKPSLVSEYLKDFVI